MQDKPDAVIASGFSRALFNPELAKLKSLNIPVVDLTTADAPGNGLSAVFDYGPDYLASGKRLADYALAQDGTNVNAVMVLSSAFANLGFVGKGFKAELNSKCPSCSVDSFEVPATSIGKDLPTRITAYFSAHPKVNWAYIGYDDMVLGVPAAMASAGLTGKVKLVTIDNEPATQAYMKNKQALVASDGFPGPEIMWRSVDFLLREYAAGRRVEVGRRHLGSSPLGRVDHAHAREARRVHVAEHDHLLLRREVMRRRPVHGQGDR